ncbi:hypothetical protein ILYODFUR_029621 [Ilyodon furcidens]|uniref:Uncharacterized protein n=1 Tax=Ilyodon furcidens TaxID=33524 RepID=A0ABV0TCC9_9TELE
MKMSVNVFCPAVMINLLEELCFHWELWDPKAALYSGGSGFYTKVSHTVLCTNSPIKHTKAEAGWCSFCLHNPVIPSLSPGNNRGSVYLKGSKTTKNKLQLV